MKYIILIILYLTLVLTKIYAQDDNYAREKEKTGTIKEKSTENKSSGDLAGKFIFGGGVGLQFGSQTFIEIAPKVAYLINPKTLAGLGLVYRYYKYQDPLTYIIYKGSDYGGNVFTSYQIFRNLIGWAEFELLNYDFYDFQSNTYSRIWVGSPFLGLGYRQAIGQKGFVQLAFLYNLYYTTSSPYSSPLVTRINVFL